MSLLNSPLQVYDRIQCTSQLTISPNVEIIGVSGATHPYEILRIALNVGSISCCTRAKLLSLLDNYHINCNDNVVTSYKGIIHNSQLLFIKFCVPHITKVTLEIRC